MTAKMSTVRKMARENCRKELTSEKITRLEDVSASVMGDAWQSNFVDNILNKGRISKKQREILDRIEVEADERYKLPEKGSKYNRSYGMDHDDTFFHTGCRSQEEYTR